MKEGRVRKVRSDKKRAIAPSLDVDTYELISHLSYVCDLPLKTVGELLSREAFNSYKILDEIKVHFRRTLQYKDDHYYVGDIQKKPYRMEKGDKRRLYLKFYEFEYENFATLAYALDCSLSAATGLLIQKAIQRKDVMYPILSRYIHRKLDPKRAMQLREICRYLDKRSPYEYITVPHIISHVLENCIETGKRIKREINIWIDQEFRLT
jgi:hypothetical protein